jgi:hypothetical protein
MLIDEILDSHLANVLTTDLRSRHKGVHLPVEGGES